MSAKRGIKLFKERAIAEMSSEFAQLDQGVMPGKPVVIPIHPTDIVALDKRQILEAVNLIKESVLEKLKAEHAQTVASKEASSNTVKTTLHRQSRSRHFSAQ